MTGFVEAMSNKPACTVPENWRTVGAVKEDRKRFEDWTERLANLPSVSCPFVFMQTEVLQEQEGINPMYVNNEADLAAKRIRHAKDRVSEISEAKRLELRKQFFIDSNELKNPLELVDAIKNGQYIIDEKLAEKNYGVTYGITFRDPSKPADRLNYDLAKLKLDAAVQDVRDVIVMSSPEAVLEALNAFKEWKLS